MSNKKKRNAQSRIQNLQQNLNPIIKIDESKGESLFMIVDFSIPKWNHVRRIISKRLANRNITAVIYSGTPGPDRTLTDKMNILQMTDAPEDKFWKAYQVLESLYKAAGGTVELRNYDGKTMHQAANLMKRLDHAKVWMGDECDRINL